MAVQSKPTRQVDSQAPPICRHIARWLLPNVAATGGVVFTALRASVHSRVALPHLAMPGVPLAMVAAILAEQWWALPTLAVCAWWWTPRDPNWGWLVAVAWGAVGGEWATLGAGALAAFPDNRLATGVGWVVAALPPVVIEVGSHITIGWD
jgi:hypothetical protein